MENDIRALIYGTLISADNHNYTEEQKQEVISRYSADKSEFNNKNWEYIYAPVDNTGRLAKLMTT